MEAVFQHTYAKKKGEIKDEDYAIWRERLREDANILRTELAKVLHSQDQRRGPP
jgi:hypothetical protein